MARPNCNARSSTGIYIRNRQVGVGPERELYPARADSPPKHMFVYKLAFMRSVFRIAGGILQMGGCTYKPKNSSDPLSGLFSLQRRFLGCSQLSVRVGRNGGGRRCNCTPPLEKRMY